MSEFCKVVTMPAKTVIVTGGKGFVGSYASEELRRRGYAVYTYDLIDGQDILNMEQLESLVKLCTPNWIIHLAGQVYLNPSLKDPQNDAKLNIIGSLNVLEVARRHGVGVTLASSGAVYGNNYQYPEPVSPYGVSKLTAETYCRLYSKLYGTHAVAFRFSSIYGLGRAPTSINLIVAKALRGETIKITGNGNQTRDYTYVADVAEALAMSVEGVFPSGVYDVGTGTATSLNQLIQLLSKILVKKIETEYVAESVGDPKRNELNVSKIANYGWKARTTLEDGLKILISKLT